MTQVSVKMLIPLWRTLSCGTIPTRRYKQSRYHPLPSSIPVPALSSYRPLPFSHPLPHNPRAGRRRQTAPRARTHALVPVKTQGPFGYPRWSGGHFTNTDLFSLFTRYTGILTPPPTVETLCVLQERRDGGNSKSIRPAKGKKNKKSKKQSSFSSAALPASDNDTKNKKNTAKIIRNTPTPPSSGLPPPVSPPKRPLPVLPSRIPIAATHRRSLEAGHKIGNSLHQPPSSKNMGARKRSSMSSMRFTPSPIKRRSQFLLGASSFSSPIRGGGRASTLSSSAITSPGKQRLPPSYASSQCLPSVETMESLSSASISSSSSSDDSSSCTGKQDNNRTVPRAQQHVSVKAEQACTTTPQQQTVRPLDTNVTINRGGLNGYRGHARLLSELSATLRLVHEEEDAVSEEALSTAASTRTPAGISS